MIAVYIAASLIGLILIAFFGIATWKYVKAKI